MFRSSEKREMIDILADHADALASIEDADEMDSAAWLEKRGPSSNRPSLLLLLQLAQALKRVLVPVSPSPLFQSELGLRLSVKEHPAQEKRPLSRGVWVGAAVAGSALSVIGLAILLLRRIRFGSNRASSAATAA